MNIKSHIALSIPFFILAFWNPWFAISGIASVLIDSDHALYYFIKFRTLNLISAYSWFYSKMRHTIMIFHTIWFWSFMAVLIYVLPKPFSTVSLFTLIGLLWHSFFDFSFEILKLNPILFRKINKVLKLNLKEARFEKREIAEDIFIKFLGFSFFPKK